MKKLPGIKAFYELHGSKQLEQHNSFYESEKLKRYFELKNLATSDKQKNKEFRVCHEITMNYIESTTTLQGLAIQAFLNEKEYRSGINFNKSEVENSIKIKRDEILPQWNYSILSS